MRIDSVKIRFENYWDCHNVKVAEFDVMKEPLPEWYQKVIEEYPDKAMPVEDGVLVCRYNKEDVLY